MHRCQGRRYEQGTRADAPEPAQAEQHQNEKVGPNSKPGPRPPQAGEDRKGEPEDDEGWRQLAWPQGPGMATCEFPLPTPIVEVLTT